jgi:Lecithin retinol acyltransferase
VVITSLNAFTQDRGYHIKRHWFRRFSPAKIVARAVSRLGERRYRLIFNNCEAFVMWCIWGVRFSNQVGHHALGLTLAIGMLISVWG